MSLAPAPLALLTPTYAADLERFQILREGLEAYGCDWPHYAVVQTEDLPLFRNALGNSRVEWLATADVLPPAIEQQRRRVSARPDGLRKLRRSLHKRLGCFPDASCDGWHTQQLVKLTAPAMFTQAATLVLDSDLVPTAPLQAEHYWRDGRAALMSEDNPTFQHWADAAAWVLGLPEAAVRPMNFVAHPFAFHAQALRDMQAHIAAQHGQPWWQVLMTQRPGNLSEFTVYGSYVRLVASRAHHFEVPANAATRWVVTAEDRSQVAQLIADSFADPTMRFLVLQASRRWPVAPYRAALGAQFARQRAAAN